MDITSLNIQQTHQGLIRKEFSDLELVKEYFKKIKKEDKIIHSFLFLCEDLALNQAKKIDEKISKNEKIGLLSGIPAAIKDNIMVQDVKCTAASKILENYVASYNATVIDRLKDHGIVILGKTNLDEFAMGSSCENSAFGPTRNPHNTTRVPGGSSGGSAAAVASDMCVFSLGSDTGGSIRLPASFCGVVGFKPTYGAVSRYGLIAFASSLDQIGCLSKTVEDSQAVFQSISGKDSMDSTSVELTGFKNFPDISGLKIENLRLGVPKEYFVKGMDPKVENVIRKAIKKYEEMGAEIIEISLPHTEYALPVYYIISPSEASANLARFDGIRYSKIQNPKSNPQNLFEVYLNNRGEGFGREVKRRIMLGTYALSSGYYDAYYLRAQKVRTLIKNDFEKAFQKVDAILTSVSPTTAFKIKEKTKDPLQMYLSDIFTLSVNLAGLPALSLPCGKVDKLPVGLQIIGKQFEDNKILEIAKLYDRNK